MVSSLCCSLRFGSRLSGVRFWDAGFGFSGLWCAVWGAVLRTDIFAHYFPDERTMVSIIGAPSNQD